MCCLFHIAKFCQIIRILTTQETKQNEEPIDISLFKFCLKSDNNNTVCNNKFFKNTIVIARVILAIEKVIGINAVYFIMQNCCNTRYASLFWFCIEDKDAKIKRIFLKKLALYAFRLTLKYVKYIKTWNFIWL